MAGGLLRRCAAGVAGGLLAVGVTVGSAMPAHAHTELDNSVPAAGVDLATTPGSVQLNFTEPIDAELSDVVVRAPDGRNLAVGPPRQSGPGLMQPITATSQAGQLEVAYRVISLDGHPVSGDFTFRVLRGDPDAADPGAGAGASGGDGGDGAGGGVSLAGPLLGAGAVGVVVVAGAVLARRRRDQSAPPAPQPTSPAS
jgi:copper resistance protein C